MKARWLDIQVFSQQRPQDSPRYRTLIASFLEPEPFRSFSLIRGERPQNIWHRGENEIQARMPNMNLAPVKMWVWSGMSECRGRSHYYLPPLRGRSLAEAAPRQRARCSAKVSRCSDRQVRWSPGSQ
jgi:hypothetical protein